MQIKSYKYKTIISLENIVSFINSFKKDTHDDVKFIEIQIKLVHSNGSEIVNITGSDTFKVNSHSKMKIFMRIINKNVKLLQPHYKNEIFSEIQFHYKEIAYSDFIRSPQKDNKLLIKNFIETVDTKNH